MTSTQNPWLPGVALQARRITWVTQKARIVQNVSLNVFQGEMLGLIGPNGSGKSSLLRLLSGAIQPQKGEVFLGEQPLHNLPRRSLARRLAFVAQSADTPDAITVWDAIELGRTPWLRALQPLSRCDLEVVQSALSAVGLQGKEQRTWHTLSGGERQRVHIARALAQQPEILLLDEPCNHLDVHQQLTLMQLVQQLPLTKVIALHDLNQALVCDRLAVMHQGQMVCIGTPDEVLTPDLLEAVFKVRAQSLIDPQDGSRVLRLRSLDTAYP